MTFSQDYLKLLEKHEGIFQTLLDSVVTNIFGTAYQQRKPTRELVYEIEAGLDYYDYYRTAAEIVIEEEHVYLEECCSQETDSTWFLDINKSFENYLQNLVNSSDFPVTLDSNTNIDYQDSLEFLIGSFYYSIGDLINFYLEKEYALLKKQYPNESFYPTAYINTKSLFYYESSRCW